VRPGAKTRFMKRGRKRAIDLRQVQEKKTSGGKEAGSLGAGDEIRPLKSLRGEDSSGVAVNNCLAQITCKRLLPRPRSEAQRLPGRENVKALLEKERVQ